MKSPGIDDLGGKPRVKDRVNAKAAARETRGAFRTIPPARPIVKPWLSHEPAQPQLPNRENLYAENRMARVPP